MATDTLFDVDLTLEVIIEEELNNLPACEGVTHPVAKWGHIPTQHATYIVGLPCGRDLLMCEGWVTDSLNYVFMDCPFCDQTHRHDQMTKLPIDTSAW